jgi:hypothetical protein
MAGQRNPVALAFVAYSLLRLALFVVPLLIIYALSRNAILSAVVAAVIGFALSMILLDRQRGSVATLLGQRAAQRKVASDEAYEDDVIDADDEAGAAEPRPSGQNDSAAASAKP